MIRPHHEQDCSNYFFCANFFLGIAGYDSTPTKEVERTNSRDVLEDFNPKGIF